MRGAAFTILFTLVTILTSCVRSKKVKGPTVKDKDTLKTIVDKKKQDQMSVRNGNDLEDFLQGNSYTRTL